MEDASRLGDFSPEDSKTENHETEVIKLISPKVVNRIILVKLDYYAIIDRERNSILAEKQTVIHKDNGEINVVNSEKELTER